MASVGLRQGGYVPNGPHKWIESLKPQAVVSGGAKEHTQWTP